MYLPKLCTVCIDLTSALWSSSVDKCKHVANADNVFLNTRSKEIRNYYYLNFLNGDWKPQLSQHFWLSMTEVVQSLQSLWGSFSHARISICASVFWNWLRNLSIWKLIQGEKKKKKKKVWFQPHQLPGFGFHTAWQYRTEQLGQRECKATFFGWNCMKSQKKQVVTSKRKWKFPESTDAFLCC